MSRPLSFSFAWQTGSRPLEPVGLAARSRVAGRLVEKLLMQTDDRLAQLRGVAGDDWVVVLGSAERLPWVDGVTYLGVVDEAPMLYIPTTRRTTVPLALVAQAFLMTFKLAPPVAVLPDERVLLSLAEARPLARPRLQAWYEEHCR